MVRWCLYLRHLSSSAYEMIRETGTIMLPSQRTLRDYTYHTKAVVGLSSRVDQYLSTVAKLSSRMQRERCVIIILVRCLFVKTLHLTSTQVTHTSITCHSTSTLLIDGLTGFVDIGEINITYPSTRAKSAMMTSGTL